MNNLFKLPVWLILGDILALLVISIIGFATHGEAISWRLLTTFLPYLAAWAVIAPWLGVYNPQLSGEVRQIWRPMLAAFLAAPMAAWLRGMWLSSAIVPIFVLVLGLSAALGYAVWRMLWTLISKRIETYG